MLIFLLIILLLVPFNIIKYSKTKNKKFLVNLLGTVLFILSLPITAYIDKMLGTIIMYMGYSIFMIGFFISTLPQSEIKTKKDGGNFLKSPLFTAIGQIVLAILLIAYGVLVFQGHKLFLLTFIFLGIGFIINSIFILMKIRSKKSP